MADLQSPSSNSQGHSHKKKKRKRTEVTLDFVPAKEGHASPFVGYFPSGYNPTVKTTTIASSEAESSAAPDIKGYQNVEKYKTRQQQLVVTPPGGHGDVDFLGGNFYGEGAVWQPGNYAVGIFNKETNTLQLVPIAGSKVLRLEPRVRGLEYDGESLTGTLDEQFSKDVMLQKKNLLTATFGTHKSRLRLSRYERSRVKDDALGDKAQIGKLFEKAADNIAVLTTDEALQQANAAITRNIPPYDATATVPENVFIFEKIITPEEQRGLTDLDTLKDAAGKPDKIEELKSSYPEFVLKRLHSIRNVTDSVKHKRVVILSYITHLLAFYRLPRNAISSLADPHGGHHISLRRANIPDVLVAKFVKIFTSPDNAKSQTVEKRNLLISYILVLGLMIDSFKADPYDLAIELRMSISTLKPHYMELGCKFKSVKESERGIVDLNSAQRLYEVVLPVPLQFPSLTDRPKKRR